LNMDYTKTMMAASTPPDDDDRTLEGADFRKR